MRFNCESYLFGKNIGGDNLLKVYNQNMQPIGILENAFDAGIERRANEHWKYREYLINKMTFHD